MCSFRTRCVSTSNCSDCKIQHQPCEVCNFEFFLQRSRPDLIFVGLIVSGVISIIPGLSASTLNPGHYITCVYLMYVFLCPKFFSKFFDSQYRLFGGLL